MRRIGNRVVRLLVAAALCALPVASHGATIKSTDIYAADGTSGQTLTTGNGVKTGHIQNKAITNAKLFGNISGAKLMNGTVTGAKIAAGAITSANLAAGAVANTAIVDGAVTTAKISDGAVTDAKISGPIATSKLIVGTVAGTVAAGDHSHDAVYSKKYAKMAVVALTGGDYSNPVTAMNNITTWCGTPSSSNPCMLKIMPGVYDLGAVTLQTQPFVDIEGSGENATVLKSSSYVIECKDNVEVRNLTSSGTNGRSINIIGNARVTHVTATVLGYGNIGIEVGSNAQVPPSTSVIISDVTVDLGTSIGPEYGIYVGFNARSVTLNSVKSTVANGTNNVAIYNSGFGEMVMNNVTAKASGSMSYGVQGANIFINNSYIYGDAAGVSSVNAGPISIQTSTIKGLSASLSLDGTAPSNIALSQLDGPVNMPISGSKCFNVYDANFLPIICP